MLGEQKLNRYLEREIDFRYFSARKMTFVCYADALAVFSRAASAVPKRFWRC